METCLGHCEASCLSQRCPFHDKGWSSNSKGNNPREAQSDGFSIPSPWFHLSGDMSSTMEDTLFPTYVLNRLGFPVSQFRMIVLSVQACILLRGSCITPFTWERS